MRIDREIWESTARLREFHLMQNLWFEKIILKWIFPPPGSESGILYKTGELFLFETDFESAEQTIEERHTDTLFSFSDHSPVTPSFLPSCVFSFKFGHCFDN